MRRPLSLLSLLLVPFVAGLASVAQSDIKKKPPISNKLPSQPNLRPKPDKVAVSKLLVSPEPGQKTVTMEIKNTGGDSALWMRWQLKMKAGNLEKYLGMGTVDSLNGGQVHTLTFQFLPPEGNVTLEAVIDSDHKVETDSAMWSNNTRTLSVLGAAPPSGLQVQELQPGQATGLTHEYLPRAGMNGCSMAHSAQGGTLSLNFTCTAEGAGDVTLFKNFTLANGFKVNASAIGSLGGGSVETRRLPAAGSAQPAIAFSVKGTPGSAPIVFVRLDVVGPAGASPF